VFAVTSRPSDGPMQFPFQLISGRFLLEISFKEQFVRAAKLVFGKEILDREMYADRVKYWNKLLGKYNKVRDPDGKLQTDTVYTNKYFTSVINTILILYTIVYMSGRHVST